VRSAWTIIGYAKKSDHRHIEKVEFSWKGWILLWFCGIVCLKKELIPIGYSTNPIGTSLKKRS